MLVIKEMMMEYVTNVNAKEDMIQVKEDMIQVLCMSICSTERRGA